ncbi:TPA: hypothetical protein TXL57_000994 [Streptococcus suis]|nr:hypothetical protein [Streptococcus suis]
MKKATKLLILFLSVVIGGVAMMNILGTENLNFDLLSSPKERQIAFLKRNESKISEYIQSYYDFEIMIKYDWDSVEVGDSGAFTTKGYNIHVDVFKNNSKINGYVFFIIPSPDTDNPQSIDSISGMNFP